MCVRLFLEGGTRIKCRIHKVFVNCFFRGIKEYENKFVEGRDINLESGSASPLGRKDRGSHPVPGSGLKQREGQRERLQFRSRFKTFVNNHLLDPDFF